MEWNPDNGIVSKAVKRTNRNLLLLCLFAFAIVFGLLFAGSNYWLTLVAGSKLLDHDELIAMQSVDFLPTMVTVQTDESFDTGYEQYLVNDNGTRITEHYYIMMLIGNERFLLVEAPPETEKLEYTGALISIPSDVQGDIVDALIGEYPDLAGTFLPVMITTEDHRTAGWIALVILGIIFIAGVEGMLRLIARQTDINQHPIYKSLARYGDPQTVIKQIEGEMALGSEQVGKLQVTPKWAITSSRTTFDAVYLKDAVWMYKMITQHRTNGIPTGKSFKVLVYDKHGHLMEVPTKKNTVDDMLQVIYQRAPWILTGFNDELQNMWKNSDGRRQMIAEVESRQQR